MHLMILLANTAFGLLVETFCVRDSLLNSGDVNIVCLYRLPSSTDEHDIAVRSELHNLPTRIK